MSPRVAFVVGLGVAILAVVGVKIATDMRTARIVKAIADADIEPDAAPDRIQTRLAFSMRTLGLGPSARSPPTPASGRGRAGSPRRRSCRTSKPATREQLFHLAEVLEASDELDLRGVAMVEDLVTNPASPLFGSSDPEVEIAARRRAPFTLGSD